MIKSYVRFFKEAVHPLPDNVFPAFSLCPKKLNARVFSLSDMFMTAHAEVDTGQTGARSRFHAGMAFLALNSDLVERVNFMRKINGLLRLRPDLQEMFRRVGETGMSRRKCR